MPIRPFTPCTRGRPLRDAINGYAATALGEVVQVCVFGRCKVKVDGSVNISIGDSLVTHAADGIAEKADFQSADNTVALLNAAIKQLAAVFAIALKASTADEDIIPCFVNKVAGDSTT